MSTQRILVVDDESDIRTLLKEILSEEGYEVDVAADAGQARTSRARQSPDLCLLDIWMPDTDGITLLREWSRGQGLDFPVVMMSGHGTGRNRRRGDAPRRIRFRRKRSRSPNSCEPSSGRSTLASIRKQSARATLPTLLAPVGKSRTMMALREQVQQVAPHTAPVLLTGESGTGREAFARYVHARSSRAEKPFIMIVAGNLSDATVEAQMRGRESDKGVEPGYYEQAGGGTLFINGLDDLHPLPSVCSPRILKPARSRASAASESIALDVRILSSTQPGLEHRSTPEPVPSRPPVALERPHACRIPPLRENAEDVPELLRHYADRLADPKPCPCAASTWRPRTGCATTPGRATFGSCATWCSAC